MDSSPLSLKKHFLLIFSYTTISYYSKGLEIRHSLYFLKKKKDCFEALHKCRIVFPFIIGTAVSLASQFGPRTHKKQSEIQYYKNYTYHDVQVTDNLFSNCSSVQVLVIVIISNYLREEMIVLTIQILKTHTVVEFSSGRLWVWGRESIDS